MRSALDLKVQSQLRRGLRRLVVFVGLIDGTNTQGKVRSHLVRKELTHMTDWEIRQSVEAELNFEPSVNASEIGVAVKDGIVTLTGHVNSYWEKIAAEEAAARVSGVKAVVNELDIRLPVSSERTDEDIARAALNRLEWTITVPKDRLKVKVSKGWVTLEGEVDWKFQKQAAEEAVRSLVGIKGVINHIVVKERPSTAQVKSAIEDALKRSAELDANRISVEVEGDKVILKGTVRSWFEREEAEKAAWRATGVRSVDNRITISTAAAAAA
jgi:osmotically-inducible protein OsmY